jgi:hypothetical protein
MSHIIRSTSFSPLRRACLGAALALSLAGCAGPSVQDYARSSRNWTCASISTGR